MKTNFRNMAWMLAATLAMTACSDSLDEASGNGNPNELIGDKGYVNIGINLPTTPSTRSESFDDGKAEEYKVNDVIIALFYGGSENGSQDAAKCKWAFQLSDADFIPSGTTTDNITSFYASGVRMIQAPGDGEKVYALAIVNPTSNFTVSAASSDGDAENSGDKVLTTFLQVNGTPFTGSLSDLNQAATPANGVSAIIGNPSNNFLMTNAPYSTKETFTSGTKPGDLEIRTLVPVTIYKDKALAEGAAKDNPIYVERAVAKTQVTVNSNDGSLTVESDVTSYDDATVTFEGWKLQNTNKKYYPVRRVNALASESSLVDIDDWMGYFNSQVKGTNYNRFIGATADPYRTYWGIDPNYDADEDDEDLSKDYNILKEVTSWNGIGYTSHESAIEYCLENTTTAQTMADNRLTSVLLKATFKPKDAQTTSDFFMKNGTSAIYNKEQFLQWATAVLTNSENPKAHLGEGESLDIKTNLTSGMTIVDGTGLKSLLTVKTSESSSKDLNDDQVNTLIADAGNNIKYYQGGVTYYYATVIKHFGDVETPLDPDAVINNASNYDEAEHLGRYGVLRNNWYELTINKVSGPGEPEIPEIPVTPPDKKNSYINCEINVLSWAKRSQGVDL